MGKAKSQRRAGAVLGYVNMAAKNLVNLLYTPMLLSFVGRGDYGVFQTANSFVYSLTLLSFGFSRAYVRFYTQRDAAGDEAGVRRLNGMYLTLYLAICVASVVLGMAAAAASGTIFSEGFTPDEVNLAAAIMRVMTLNISVTLFSTVFDAYITAKEQFIYRQTRQTLTTLATPVAALVLLHAGMGAVGVALAQLFVSVVLLGLNARYSIVKLGMKFDLTHFDSGLLRAVAAFSAWIFANQICDMVNQNVPNVVLGALCGSSIVAVFAVAVQIRNVFFSLSTTMSSVFIPLINRIVATTDDNAELTRLMTRVGRYQMILFCWVYGGFALLGEFFITRWAGEGFADAYWLTLAMVLPVMVPLTQNTGIEIQQAKNRHRARSIVYLFMAIASVLFTLATAKSLGYWAPAIAYVASITLGNGIFMNWYYHTNIGLDMVYFWRRNAPVFVCSLVVTLVCLVVSHAIPVTGWMSFLIWGAVYSAVFCAALWAFVLEKEERVRVVKKVMKR